MSTRFNLLQYVQREDLNDDDRILLEVELEDPQGVPTDKGVEIMEALLWKGMRHDVADKARAMRAYKAAKEAAKRGDCVEEGTEAEAAEAAKATAKANKASAPKTS